MPTPFHQPGCNCNLCYVRDHVVGVDPKRAGCETASEKQPRCGVCLACRVMNVALQGATTPAFVAAGFQLGAPGEKLWKSMPEWRQEQKRKQASTAPTADPKLPTV